MLSNKKPRKSTGQEVCLQSSPWQEELPREVTELILQHLQCDSRHHSAIFRQVCRQWLSFHDSLLQTLHPTFIPSSCNLHLKFPLLRALKMKEEVTGKYPTLHADEILNRISECSGISLLKIRNRDKISAVGAKFLASLSNLTDIDVVNVSISQEGWVALHGLSSLTSLICVDLGTQTRGDEAPLILNGFQSLKNLKMGAEDMTEIELDGLSTLTTLTSLDLWWSCKDPHRTVQGGLRPVSALKLLSSLSLCSDEVTNEGLKSISKLTNLTHLCLDYCANVSDNGIAALADLTSLNSISLSACSSISDNGVEALSVLTSLTSINLSYCFLLTKSGLQHLSKLSLLVMLNLAGCNHVNDEGVMAICSLKHLSTLNLKACCQISDNGLASLRRLEDLRWLDLSFCSKVSLEAIQACVEKFPHLKIVR